MSWRIISLPLIVLGVLLYHVAQKSIPKHVDPMLAFTVAYGMAFLICVSILVLSGGIQTLIEEIRGRDWIPILMLGFSLVPVELGYLYAYRTGWKISTTSITLGPFIAVALALIGVLWYKEELSLTNIIGIGLCIAGVACANYQ